MSYENEIKNIEQFESSYDYDTSYMKELLDSSSAAYQKFSALSSLAVHREKLGLEEYWVAKFAAIVSEDCGPCLQLNIKLGIEQGLKKELAEKTIRSPKSLPEALYAVYQFSSDVAANRVSSEVLHEKIHTAFSRAELLEMGICISTARMYPALKRAIGNDQSCSLLRFSF